MRWRNVSKATVSLSWQHSQEPSIVNESCSLFCTFSYMSMLLLFTDSLLYVDGSKLEPCAQIMGLWQDGCHPSCELADIVRTTKTSICVIKSFKDNVATTARGSCALDTAVIPRNHTNLQREGRKLQRNWRDQWWIWSPRCQVLWFEELWEEMWPSSTRSTMTRTSDAVNKPKASCSDTRIGMVPRRWMSGEMRNSFIWMLPSTSRMPGTRTGTVVLGKK